MHSCALVIASVSLTLRNVLTAAVQSLGTPPNQPFAEIVDLQDPVASTPPRLTLFLYEVIEDPSARNRPRVRGDIPPDIFLRRPRMALLLRYLMTPWGGDFETEQNMLARGMQALYDGAIIGGTTLAGDLANTNESLKISMAQLPIEDRTRIWSSVQRPYKLSIIYEVRVVPIESTAEQQITPVNRRTVDYGVPV